MGLLFSALVAGPCFAQNADAETRNWELCPDPMQALSDVPGELDQLQADIDRYTLCLDRASLLLKLEDLRNQNQKDAMGMAGMNLPTAMPPLSPQQASQLLDSGPTPPSAEEETPALSTDKPKDQPPIKGYVIRDVRGMGGVLTARVQSPDGNYEEVKTGDRLADGAEVTAVTTTTVTVTKDGAVKRLSWDD